MDFDPLLQNQNLQQHALAPASPGQINNPVPQAQINNQVSQPPINNPVPRRQMNNPVSQQVLQHRQQFQGEPFFSKQCYANILLS